ncbi:MerR family transcriptional regulator [Virgibacillus pantothenticus]|uniref:MerR family transcriptional regulator n=1 Tax=Virgibacillus pantothenticus TaxID=1473 RepID=A0A0L0QNZ5_VIRPA|nr:MerR family transcriptional regulator [Virgibacillus pantothenticus]KNE20307.1 MerR family transcriptional regulator [Virgibacillus pantothenticus]MBU8568056.1 MerR family transcriptional regulator [Virgibacillus pantothenticus]MBU8602002.1 MerR family transcriptional regulator [Virgibacillus pantothenticus]MBU8636252.1 MerR family transcriptional regulator [Virgibacillus pantothenticus]MBU8643772.1 MerR family transcriptional regulator [Virgibacillus pantothenticus]
MYTIGKLSKKTGVTVRTLDYYDEIGLLQPQSTTEGGHRLYGEEEVFRLEQILSLKFLGFSLDKIQCILQEPSNSWEDAFGEQLIMVQEQKKHIEELEQSLRTILYTIQIEKEINWELVFGIMQLFQKKNNKIDTILNQYMSEEEKEKILSVNMDEDKLEIWVELINEIKENLHAAPESEIAQKLADRWIEGVVDMFGEDKEFLDHAWNAINEESDGVMFYPMTKEVIHFINEAMAVREKRGDI